MDNGVVSHNEIYPVIRIIWNLGSAHKLALMATGIAPSFPIPVNEEKGLQDYVGASKMVVDRLARNHQEVSQVPNEMQKWLDKFEKDYGDPKARFNTKPLSLQRGDAIPLAEDIGNWFEKIYKIYEKSNTKLLNENEFTKNVIELAKKLDDEEKRDLHDGYECLVNNIPTPGAMILHRVGESMVQKFYTKEMGHEPPEGSTMGSMAKELREKQANEIESGKRNRPDPLVNYILYQTEERNLAQHPERRFDQTGAEEVFIFVKKLINDIHERLEK